MSTRRAFIALALLGTSPAIAQDDFNIVMLNVGVGVGATDAGNTLVFKSRLGWIFK